MASNKNNTRKRNRNKKTYRKRNRKATTKRMMVGGNPFYSLFTGIKSSFSIFGSKTKEDAVTAFNTTKADAEAKIEDAKTTLRNTQDTVNKKAACVASCAKL